MDEDGKPGKSKFAWTAEKIEALIAKYEAEEILWNPRLRHNSTKGERQRSLTRLAKALGGTLTAMEVHEKIRNIRTYYRHELSKKAMDRNYYSCWRYFDSIDAFLRPTITIQKPYHLQDSTFPDLPDEESLESEDSNKQEQYPENEDEQDQDHDQNNDKDQETEHELAPNNFPIKQEISAPSPPPQRQQQNCQQQQQQSLPHLPPPNKKRRVAVPFTPATPVTPARVMEEAVEVLSSYKQKALTPSKHSVSQNETFGKFIVSELNCITDEAVKDKLKLDIHKLIVDAKYTQRETGPKLVIRINQTDEENTTD